MSDFPIRLKEDDAPLMPTHTCFDDAMEYLEHRIKQDNTLARSDSLILVHAICLAPEGPKKGQPFTHAWVEERVGQPGYGEWLVWEAFMREGQKLSVGVVRESHRELFKVVEESRYTPRDVWQRNKQTMSYGPWEEKYRALCLTKGETAVVFRPGETR